MGVGVDVVVGGYVKLLQGNIWPLLGSGFGMSFQFLGFGDYVFVVVFQSNWALKFLRGDPVCEFYVVWPFTVHRFDYAVLLELLRYAQKRLLAWIMG